MPSIIEDTRSSLKPIYEAKPDMRFATTFLSNKYREYSVKGETIQDKVTGEIFTRRHEDGRVVSFFQNKKYLHDLALELRILLNNNSHFHYPDESDAEACYLSTDYDVMSIYGEKDVNILYDNLIIPNTTENPVDNLRFKISKKSNGFFCRLTSRDSDKTIIEWVTAQYNYFFQNYQGIDPTFLKEKEKLETIEKWKDSNAVIDYTVKIIKDGAARDYNVIDYIRVNEESGVIFPASIGEETLRTADYVYVKINSISFDKLHFMYHYRASLPVEFSDGFDKFIYPDMSIFIRYINVCSFVDRAEDVDLKGNEFIVALMDVPYIYRYMMKMNMLVEDSSVLVSPTRPGSDTWKTNGIWAEQVRDVFKGGYTINMECEVDLKQLENFLAENDDTDYVSITMTPDDKNIYGKQV